MHWLTLSCFQAAEAAAAAAEEGEEKEEETTAGRHRAARRSVAPASAAAGAPVDQRAKAPFRGLCRTDNLLFMQHLGG